MKGETITKLGTYLMHSQHRYLVFYFKRLYVVFTNNNLLQHPKSAGDNTSSSHWPIPALVFIQLNWVGRVLFHHKSPEQDRWTAFQKIFSNLMVSDGDEGAVNKPLQNLLRPGKICDSCHFHTHQTVQWPIMPGRVALFLHSPI